MAHITIKRYNGSSWDELFPSTKVEVITNSGGTSLQTLLDGKISALEKGVANGVPTLDANVKIPSAFLPSYVDDVVDLPDAFDPDAIGVLTKVQLAATPGDVGTLYYNRNAAEWYVCASTTEFDSVWNNVAAGSHPTLETGKIFVCTKTGDDLNKIYRYSGTALINISSDTNNYVSGVSFNSTNGVLTINRAGLTDLTVDLDGKYQDKDSDLDAISALASTGLAKRTGTGTWATVPDNSSNWDAAYTDRNKWDGGPTGLNAGTGRASLGANAVGSNIFTMANPGAIRFIRINADNSVSALSDVDFRNAIGAADKANVTVFYDTATGAKLNDIMFDVI